MCCVLAVWHQQHASCINKGDVIYWAMAAQHRCRKSSCWKCPRSGKAVDSGGLAAVHFRSTRTAWNETACTVCESRLCCGRSRTAGSSSNEPAYRRLGRGHTHCRLVLPQQTLSSGAPLTACCVSASLARRPNRFPVKQLPLEPQPILMQQKTSLQGFLQQTQPRSEHAVARTQHPLASAMQAYLSWLLDFTGSVVPQGKGLLLEKLKQSAMHPATKVLHLKKSSTGTNAASIAHCPSTLGLKSHLSF